MYYVAGWNLPGCLPEMEPARFESEDTAKEFIKDELNQIEDEQIQVVARVQDVEEHFTDLVQWLQAQEAPLSFYDTVSGLSFWIDLVPEEDLIAESDTCDIDGSAWLRD